MFSELIIEGPDQSGKTTLAKALAKRLGWEYVHMTKPPVDFNYLEGYLHECSRARVHDRFHLGAVVYGRNLGLHPTDGWTVSNFMLLRKLLNWMNVGTMLCYYSNQDDLRRTLKESPKEEMFPDKILAANIVYNRLAKFCDYTWDISHAGWPRLEDVLVGLEGAFGAREARRKNRV